MICPECKGNVFTKCGKSWQKDQLTGVRVKVPKYQCKQCGKITVSTKLTDTEEDNNG